LRAELTIASVFDHQLYNMNGAAPLYSMPGGSAEAGPLMAKARPMAAAMAATIRAILIPTPDAAHRGIKKGRQMTRTTAP
jgi:hypothetical protein